jgi:polysaccharide export outer membrane protein
LIRRDRVTGTEKEYRLRISKLLKRGDRTANVKLEPGDVIIIPESSF